MFYTYAEALSFGLIVIRLLDMCVCICPACPAMLLVY